MPNTDHFQVHPDFFSSREEGRAIVRQNTNPRYKFFRQTHFTAGDYEQFLEFWDRGTHRKICHAQDGSTIRSCPLYKDLSTDDIIHTFEYIFHKFKKGIFVKIIDNEVKTFLPFSKIDYMNEWSDRIRVDPGKYPKGVFSLLEKCADPYPYDKNKIHYMMDHWYANNGLLRYEYPISENDSGISTLRDMLLTLAKEREIPDCEFFINKRDFPILHREGREAYDAIFGESPLLSHKYDKYCPILGMTTTDDHADIPIPTWDDWARVSYPEKMFGKDFIEYPDIPIIPFRDKIPSAVFRGASTGLGTTSATNPRLFFALLSMEGRKDEDGHPFLDCGITKWNCRPRCTAGGMYDTIDPSLRHKIPLASFLTHKEQAQYKYILHLPGHSEAYRLSVELAMGSVILLYPCRYKLWYTDQLLPYVHYVPIDPSRAEDIYEKIQWCKTHETECEQITMNARRFYEERLSRTAILDRMRDVLCGIQQQTGLIVFPPRHMKEFQYSLQSESLRIENIILRNKMYTSLIPAEKDMRHLHPRTFQIILHHLPPEYILGKIRNTPILKQSRSMELRRIEIMGRSLCIKTPIHASEYNLTHECFIGQIGLNRVANVCPFVVFTYGRWENHIVTDMVEGKTLETMLHEIPTEKILFFFISILQQLSLILQFLQSEYGFIHYDCYPWNIMICPNTTHRIFHFPMDTRTVRYCPEYYPVLIDFGKSHLLYQNSHFVNVSPFHLHLHQDILSIFIAGLYIILHHHKIPRSDIGRVVQLMNYLGKTSFTNYKHFEHMRDIKVFLKTKKKYSNILLNDKQDYKDHPPIKIFNTIHPPMKCQMVDRVCDLHILIETHYSRQFVLYELHKASGIEFPIDRGSPSHNNGQNLIHRFFKMYIDYCLCAIFKTDQQVLLRQMESLSQQQWDLPPSIHPAIICDLPRFFSHPDITKMMRLPLCLSTNHYFERHKIFTILLHATSVIPNLSLLRERLMEMFRDYTPSILGMNRHHASLSHLSRYRRWCAEE